MRSFKIGTRPSREKFVKTTPDRQFLKSILESGEYISFLKDLHGEPPDGCNYSIEFKGDTAFAALRYDRDNEEHIDYVFTVKDDIPAWWPTESKNLIESLFP